MGVVRVEGWLCGMVGAGLVVLGGSMFPLM